MVTRYKKESGRKILFRASGRILVNGRFHTSFHNFERFAKNEKDFRFLIKYNLVKDFDIKQTFIEIEFSQIQKNPSQ